MSRLPDLRQRSVGSRASARILMPNTETYTLVWLGTREPVPAAEVESIAAGTNTRVAWAVENGLAWFCDTFTWDEETGEPAYSFLSGRCVRILGYKEGEFEGQLDPDELAEQSRTLRAAFARAGKENAVQLFVLFHDAARD